MLWNPFLVFLQKREQGIERREYPGEMHTLLEGFCPVDPSLTNRRQKLPAKTGFLFVGCLFDTIWFINSCCFSPLDQNYHPSKNPGGDFIFVEIVKFNTRKNSGGVFCFILFFFIAQIHMKLLTEFCKPWLRN